MRQSLNQGWHSMVGLAMKVASVALIKGSLTFGLVWSWVPEISAAFANAP